MLLKSYRCYTKNYIIENANVALISASKIKKLL